MGVLGSALSTAGHQEDALPVKEAECSTWRRLGASEEKMLIMKGNLAITYEELGRLEEALEIKRDVYSGHLRLNGTEHYDTIREAFNYARSLAGLERVEEAKSLLRRTLPVARRVSRDSSDIPIRMRALYAEVLYNDAAATLDDLREAVTTLEDTEGTARRVLGGAHPLVEAIERHLRRSRAALAAASEVTRVKLAKECSEIAKTFADTTL